MLNASREQASSAGPGDLGVGGLGLWWSGRDPQDVGEGAEQKEDRVNSGMGVRVQGIEHSWGAGGRGRSRLHRIGEGWRPGVKDI